MIENAVYQCRPPERVEERPRKVRSSLDMFVRKLLQHDLSKGSVDRILGIFLKLDWKNEVILEMMTKRFSKVWKLKYSQLDCAAFICTELSKFYPVFGINVLDDIVEYIQLGMERNIFLENQQRIALVKYLGELCNFKMIDSTLIFDILYLILTYGYGISELLTCKDKHMPLPEAHCSIDSKSDFFRVRLCCTILETCGIYFKKGLNAKKLDKFLLFLQVRYILIKDFLVVYFYKSCSSD